MSRIYFVLPDFVLRILGFDVQTYSIPDVEFNLEFIFEVL